jgi:primosomal protein N' (replication factor Y) (superfamily II helicase)
MFADVYISYPLEECYTYRIPDGMNVTPCCRVRVNFAGRIMTANVIRVHDNKPKDFEVKDIINLIDTEPIYDGRLMDLARYTASNYISSVGEALAMALPSALKPSMRYKIPYNKSETRQEVLLNEEQKQVFNDITKHLGTVTLTHLVFGITGSGKTEIYIEIARRLISQGQSVIYLVPEISLSSMIFERLYGVFGDDLIIYHSHLTPNQRLYNWIRFYRGEAHIAVGTRSAVFLQCPKLGMIVIDEEHDGSYKEHSTPRYNARRIALYRSKKEGALVVMGSATPAVETLYACEKGVIKLHTLTNRYGNASLPEIDIVKINSTKPRHIISPVLKLHTKRAIDAGRQVIYLLNRRGFAPIVICNSCGWTVECPHCSIGMNYHKDRHMLCHYCGHQQAVPVVCARCGSEQIDKVGSGTQRIEEIIEKEFADFVIFRLDQDSSRKKDTVPDLIGRMNRGEVNILVGTQLVAKGFDFHNITLVGVLLADIGMNMPDFRSTERIFSLLMQVAGRSGRGEAPGKVIIQTLDDQNPLFRHLQNHDYYGFYRSELEVRKMLQYPPFSRLARLLVRGANEARVVASINSLKQALDEQAAALKADITILGPSSAPFGKIGGNYRHHIIIKSGSVTALQEVIVASRCAVAGRDVYLEIDIDPYELM